MLLTWHGGLALIKNETPQDVDVNGEVEGERGARLVESQSICSCGHRLRGLCGPEGVAFALSVQNHYRC